MSAEAPKKAGNPKGTSQIRNSGVKKIQALAMMRELALGKPLAEVAKQFNTSTSIVRARLSYAQRAGLFVHHEDVILTQMVPAAQNVLLAALHDPFLDPALRIKVALEVEKGVGLLRKPGGAVPAALQGANKQASLTLQDYINQLRDSTGKLPEGVAIEADYTEHSLTGVPESLALPTGEHLPSAAEQEDSGSPDGAHGEPTAPTGEGDGTADQEVGTSFATFGRLLSQALERRPGQAGGEDFREPAGDVGDAAGQQHRSDEDSGQAAEEPIQEPS